MFELRLFGANHYVICSKVCPCWLTLTLNEIFEAPSIEPQSRVHNF